MVNTIDHYSHWNKVRNKKVLDRENKSLNFLLKVAKNGNKILDAGCGNGKFLEMVSNKSKNFELYGLDFSKSEVNEAKKKGFNVKEANFEENIKFSSNLFDVIHAAEIIEHLYNPDNFLQELNRVLKKGGYLVMSTPNLCAWFNRLLVPIGVQPLFMEVSTKSKLIGSGFLAKFKKESNPVGHVRIFTLLALKDILKVNGFEILETKGAIFDEGLPSKLLWVDRIFNFRTSLSSNMIILAKKVK
jgi:2-polyprenyl-3-methyl-5-hydroxy-6-metoxy-1,4-benzoquinol methylase